jgi:ABC-type transporter Mla subunit MlaD
MAAINKNELKVGLFILIPAVIIMLLVLLKLGYSIADSTMDVYLKTDSIAAIKKGTAIKIKGYTIGRVVELIPVYKPSLHFLAVMRISTGVELSENCTAVIMNQNIIGDTVVEFRNPEIKGEPLLPGDVIEGIEYVNLEAILQDVHMLLTTLTGTVDVVKQISLESRENIRSLLGNLSSSVENLNLILANSQADLLAILASFRKTSQTLDEISAEIKKNPMKFILKGEAEKKPDKAEDKGKAKTEEKK